MAASAPHAADEFQDTLAAALKLTLGATTAKTRDARDRIFSRWEQFCSSLNVESTLRGIPRGQARLAYLLVFGMRYRQAGQTGKPVRADTVEDALLAVRPPG